MENVGKVFNDQIIKVLCAKNISKIQNDVGEPNLKKKCSCLRRGESYVVFLDRNHRKQLQRQMGGMDLKPTAGEKSLCTISSTPAGNTKNGGDENWLRQTLNLKRAAGGNASSVKTQICDSLSAVLPMRVLDLLKQRTRPGENERMTPSVFGPFLDEPVCGFVDHLFYFICVLFGIEMQAQEPCA